MCRYLQLEVYSAEIREWFSEMTSKAPAHRGSKANQMLRREKTWSSRYSAAAPALKKNRVPPKIRAFSA